MSFWTSIRDTVQSVAVLAGNTFIPGSSILTSQIASKGSQEQLNSTLGTVAQIGSSLYGASNMFGGSGTQAPVTDGSMVPTGNPPSFGTGSLTMDPSAASSIYGSGGYTGGAANVAAGGSATGGLWDSAGKYIPNIISGGLNLVGGYLQGQQAQDAAATQSQAILGAARIAADAAKFKPIGVTSRFGASQFGYDANGNLNSAGYQLSPEAKAQQDRLMAISNRGLTQFNDSFDATQPMFTAANRSMDLGNQYLTTSPQAQAQKYYADQMALLDPSRTRSLDSLRANLQATGRAGLSTGGTSTMGAANPEMEAYYNSLRQQDALLASQATQGGIDYAKAGLGFVGSGGDMMKNAYSTQTSSFAPYSTALGGANTLEGLGAGTMDAGTAIGAKLSTSGANAGQLALSGATNAATAAYKGDSYSPWGGLLTGAGTALNNYANPAQAPLYNSQTGARLA
jgi:hypothetical protein